MLSGIGAAECREDNILAMVAMRNESGVRLLVGRPRGRELGARRRDDGVGAGRSLRCHDYLQDRQNNEAREAWAGSERAGSRVREGNGERPFYLSGLRSSCDTPETATRCNRHKKMAGGCCYHPHGWGETSDSVGVRVTRSAPSPRSPRPLARWLKVGVRRLPHVLTGKTAVPTPNQRTAEDCLARDLERAPSRRRMRDQTRPLYMLELTCAFLGIPDDADLLSHGPGFLQAPLVLNRFVPVSWEAGEWRCRSSIKGRKKEL